MRLVRGGYQIQIKAAATFLVNLSAHGNIFFIIKVKILVLIKWSYRSLPNYVYYNELIMVILFNLF